MLLGIPIILCLSLGGCYYICPQFGRLEAGAKYNPPLVKVRTMMRFGLFAVIGFGVVISGIYNILWSVFRIELAYPLALSWTRKAVITAGVFAWGIGGLISWRTNYAVYDAPSRPWPLSRVLRASGFLILWVGLFIAPVWALLGLTLIVAGGILFPAGSVLRRMSVPSPVALPPTISQRQPVLISVSQNSNGERLRVSKQVADKVVEEYGKRVLAVFMFGAGADRNDWPCPEVEILVVVRGGDSIRSKRYVFQGLSIGLYYWEESRILKTATDFDDDWPNQSSYLRVRTVLFERDGWLRHLEKALAENDRADPSEAIRGSTWKMNKWILYLRSDRSRRDSIETMKDCEAIANNAVNIVYLLNRRYYTESYWKEVFTCPTQPKDFRRLVEVSAGFVPATEEEAAKAAEALGEEILEMVRLKGVSIESSELKV